MDNLQAHSIARDWLARWADVVNCSPTDLDHAMESVFVQDGWLRDLLVLGDDFHTAHGHNEVAHHLRRCITHRNPGIHDIRLDTDTSQDGAFVAETPGGVCVTLFFLLDRTCPDLATVRGCARLMLHEGTWKAWTVLLMLHNFNGFEESFRRDGRTATTEMPWDDVLEEERAIIEADPEVLIVGAGHNGMMTAARLRRLGIRTLIVDRTEDVGSNWSKRYERLRLHTPAFMNTFPYQDFPSTWPKYLPKSRVASFLRFYAESQDLTIWTSTTISRDTPPAYDADTQRWQVHLERSGSPIVVRPRHLVLATGWLGLPRELLHIPGRNDFRGSIFHTSRSPRGDSFAGKKVVIIGVGNSGGDAATAAVAHDATTVTLVQRSPSLVTSMPAAEALFYDFLWPGTVPIVEQDLLNYSMPNNLLLNLLRSGLHEATRQVDTEMLEGLEKRGFQVSNTPLLELLLKRHGGFMIDQGAVKHILDGRVGVKSGVEVSSFEPDAVVFSDGSRLEADVVVLATGYTPVLDAAREVIGPVIADKITSGVWGLDETGEMNNSWRPTAQPGLWFAVGDFTVGRFFSRLLALQILQDLRVEPFTQEESVMRLSDDGSSDGGM